MKLILIAACTIAGELQSRHADVADTVDVPKDDANTLTRMGRALYLEKSDDPTKGQLTATRDDIDAIRKQAKAIAAAAEARELEAAAGTPAALAQLVAVNVATAVAAALAKPAA
jgi:hypothetical protein